MSMLTTRSIQQIFEQAVNTGVDTFKAQSGYMEALAKRHGKAVSSLASTGLSNLEVLAGSKTFTQVLEANLAFEESLREELGYLHEENVQAWKDLQNALKSIYLPANDSAQVTAKKTAPGSKKAA